MSARPPTIYLIAGCNGAGKTTFAKEFLLKEVGCSTFLNADYLALGLSPLSPEIAAMKAGRLLLTEFKALVIRKETFALESTLSGLTYLRLLREAKRRGFQVYIHFLWLQKPATAIARVRERVKKGGHNVPVTDIRRRFGRGLQHFIRDYAPLADRWAVWDNMVTPPELRADSKTCTQAELQRMLTP
ncbi:MAG TPA: Zeta toxin family protein [Verrucomicrobiae bacterium]|nr:Zeta toxin family protein [Verrucomicrobiae bacterium]